MPIEVIFITLFQSITPSNLPTRNFLTHPAPIPNYQFLYSPHSISSSSILIHHKTPYIQPNITSIIPCTLARVFIQRWITLVSVYFSPSKNIDFDAFCNLLSQLTPPLLIVGDFNCCHTFWGDSIVTFQGWSLEQFLSSTDFLLLNSNHPTRFDTRTHTFSSIDLSICSPSLNLSFHWSVVDQFLTSEHSPILPSHTSYTPLPNPPHWHFDRADWHLFSSLSYLSLPPSSFSSASDKLIYFTTSILSASLTSVLQTNRPFTSKCVPWWTRALCIKREVGAVSDASRTHLDISLPLYLLKEHLLYWNDSYENHKLKAGEVTYPP